MAHHTERNVLGVNVLTDTTVNSRTGYDKHESKSIEQVSMRWRDDQQDGTAKPQTDRRTSL
jgi:hypothetical protein